MWKIFMVVLALAVVAELFVEKRTHFEVERVFGGYAAYGFLACAALVLIAKALGVLLKRPDDYYGDD